MTFRKIVSDSALVLSGEVIERVLRLVLVIFSARLLGDVNYGKFTFALSFTSLFMILADGGLHQLIVREIARNREKAQVYVQNGLLLKCILAAVTGLLIYVIVQWTGKPADVMLAVYIMAAAMIVGSFSEFFASIFRAHQRMTYDVAAMLIFGAVVTCLGVTMLFLGFDYVALSYVYLLAHVLRLFYCMVVVHLKFTRLKLRLDRKVAGFLIREGFPFGILYFFALMYTYVDSTMLSIMIGDQVVGWYNAAYRLVFAMLFIPVASMKAIFPAMSLYYKESAEAFKSLFERSFKIMFLVGFALASLIYSLADRIIVIIFGEEYAPAAGALKILVWSTAIIFVGTVQTHATRASNHQGFTAKVVAASAALNVILNLFLIPKYSLYGAAFATIASELFTFVFHSFYLTKKLFGPPILKLAPKIAAICLVTGVYIRVIYEFNLFFIVPTSLLVMLGMLFLTRYFTKEEVAFIKSLVKAPGRISVSKT